jgi:hypothetical protein
MALWLIAAIDWLPGPPGIVYLVTTTLAALALHALEWATGVLHLGRFSFSVGSMIAQELGDALMRDASGG